MRKKRGYQRDTPLKLVRDYKLFAIACEGGKREPEYFRLFEHISRKVTVDIIEDKISTQVLKHKYETKSAPKWVLDRAVKYIEKEGLTDEDDLWFVMDKDRWTNEQLHTIADYCNDYPNWHIVISNPCFEVWLYFHKKSKLPESNILSCKTLKTAVAELEKGGYHPYKFISALPKAILNAEKADTNGTYFLSNPGETKIYQLGKALIQVIGKNDFETFLQTKLIELSKK